MDSRWQKFKDKDSGRDYYYDPDTGVTSWEAPCVQTDSSATHVFPSSGRTDDEEYDDYDDLCEIPLVSEFAAASFPAASDVDGVKDGRVDPCDHPTLVRTPWIPGAKTALRAKGRECGQREASSERARNALDIHTVRIPIASEMCSLTLARGVQESSNSNYFHSSHREEWNDDGTRQGGVAEKLSKREHCEVAVEKTKQQMQTEPQVQSCPRPVTIGGQVVGELGFSNPNSISDLEFTQTTEGSASGVRVLFAPAAGPAPVIDLDTTAGLGLFLLLTKFVILL
jgi:hypothetical protein